MSKDARYRKEISKSRWQILAKQLKAEAHMTCSMCNLVTPSLAVHHIQPVEGLAEETFMRKFYDRSNLQVLCYQCHKEVHEAMGSRGRQGHEASEQRRRERNEANISEITIPTW